MTEKEILTELRLMRRQIDVGVSLIENGDIKKLPPPENEHYQKQYGDFDFLIGDYAVKKIHGRIFNEELKQP